MLITRKRKLRETRELKIYEAYQALIEAGAMITAAEEMIMEKFAIAHRSTVFQINRRVKRRISQPAKR